MRTHLGIALVCLALVVTIASCGGGGGGGVATFTVGGTVSGLNGTVVLQNNNGDDLTLTADGVFTFATKIATGSAYSVTVLTQPAFQTCTASSNTGTMGTANVTDVSVVCSTDTYSVGGIVSGLSGTVVLQNNGIDDLSLSSNGTFTFATKVADGGGYNVTVKTQPATQTCTASSNAGTVAGANVTNVSVTCSTNTYSVGGTVSGLTGTGLVLRNNAADDLSVAASSTSFTFATKVAAGAGYAVTIKTQPTGQQCLVTDGTGTMGSAAVTSVAVTCMVGYPVSGTVSGLTGTVVLQNNGADDLSLTSNGAFIFSTGISDGSAYKVTVKAHPKSQRCTVSNPTGTIASSAVTNVAVDCVTHNVIFVTSTTHTGGSIGGLAGGDAICAARATAAGLPGNYVSYLSTDVTDTTNAKDRLGSARGWIRPDGLPFADTVADLVAGKIFYPPRLDEFGADVGKDVLVYTGSMNDGTPFSGNTCLNWTSDGANSYVGYADATSGYWTSVFGYNCNVPRRIYCMGTDHTNAITPLVGTGRKAFVSTLWSSGTGTTGADSRCASDASGNSLTGTFKALLPTDTASAASRFTLTGEPWSRLDGVIIVNSAGDLASDLLLAPINVLADGSYSGGGAVWTGADSPAAVAAVGQNCTNWTSSAGGQNGQISYSSRSYIGPQAAGHLSNTATCSFGFVSLWCLQE